MMMAENGRVWTQAELIREIEARFGPGARFHTCSADNLTAAGLVAFLAARGKFAPAGDGGADAFTADPSQMCND